MKENTRKDFYVSTELWGSGLSNKAKLVFTYLCYCCDKNGECFPSVARIVEECCISISTARRAVKELVEKGYVSCEQRMAQCRGGAKRQTSNVYRILVERGAPGAKRGESAEAGKAEQSAKQSGEVAANTDIQQANSGGESSPADNDIQQSCGPVSACSSPLKPKRGKGKQKSVCGAGKPSPAVRYGVDEDVFPFSSLKNAEPEDASVLKLRELLERLDLRNDLFRDKEAARAIEYAISDMWFAEKLRICGENVPNWRIRERLMELDNEAIEEVMRGMETEEVTDEAAYLKSCIYNAPLRVNARTANMLAALHKEDWLKEQSKLRREREDRVKLDLEALKANIWDGT